MLVPKSLQNLIEEFEKLPTIGPKSASRLAYSLINSGDAKNLSRAISEASDNLRRCETCSNIAEESQCEVCKSTVRNKSKICIVEDALDLMAIERMNKYDGVYHVLGGLISPLEDTDNINLKQLISRLHNLSEDNEKVEVISAINQSIEGEITLMYIKDGINNLLNGNRIELTRLASGLPTGADIEYTDQMTLSNAFDARLKV